MIVRPWVAIRADGTHLTGSGHIMRCRTIALALKRRSVDCCFITRNLDPALADLLRRDVIEVLKLPTDGPVPDDSQGDYGKWLGTTMAHDAAETTQALETHIEKRGTKPLTVLVDHYGLDREWEQAVNSATRLRIGAFDDLNRPHESAFVVDPTFGKTTDAYAHQTNDDCELMIGTNYAVLRPDFARERAALSNESHPSEQLVRDLLISMGGVDERNLTQWVLEALLAHLPDKAMRFHALVGGSYRHREKLEEFANRSNGLIQVHSGIDDMAAFLTRFDLCIGAAGSSTWERCCVGLPTLTVVQADNQRQIAANLSQAGTTAFGGDFVNEAQMPEPREWVHETVLPLIEDASKRNAMAKAARELVDGHGLARVLRALIAEGLADQEVAIRAAVEGDIGLIHEWQCFPDTRAHAVNSKVPTLSGHTQYMRTKIADENSHYMIVERTGVPVGVVRLDPVSDEPMPGSVEPSAQNVGLVSIFTAPEHYRTGVGLIALKMLQQHFPKHVQIAQVLKDNGASHRLFTKAGFVGYTDEYYFWQAKPPSHA
ncbi:UDP-2,4-diacetamido-2,4,6-trideoxy-beta-L-altropyranose hydrolase [Pseudahrensia aquimaris]|uniref:UDP-2,4-diacetamido-2,4, 6-trideoxy-beta-L-altropyranose hydrolase n=1 Tax=Pseudahrensia aquimaris TaxID=744461 RepID=A0ABW3FKW7_9HYPH